MSLVCSRQRQFEPVSSRYADEPLSQSTEHPTRIPTSSGMEKGGAVTSWQVGSIPRWRQQTRHVKQGRESLNAYAAHALAAIREVVHKSVRDEAVQRGAHGRARYF